MAVKRLAWSVDGWVSSTISAELHNNTLVIRGLASTDSGRVSDWSAMITPNGWLIEVEGLCGPEQFQGSTFNLPLEVMAAMRRSL